MTLTVQYVRLGNAFDTNGALVFRSDVLVAVISQLSLAHGQRQGRWYIECTFATGLETRDDFDDLEATLQWIKERLEEQDAKTP